MKKWLCMIAVAGLTLGASSAWAGCGACGAHKKGEAEHKHVLCTKCGEEKGSEACCKEGAEKCAACGLNKGSEGCQAKCAPKAE